MDVFSLARPFGLPRDSFELKVVLALGFTEIIDCAIPFNKHLTGAGFYGVSAE